MLIDTKREE